MILVCLYKIY